MKGAGKNNIAGIADDFISLLFPRRCHACGEMLVKNEKFVCTGCIIDIPETAYHLERDNILEKRFYGRVYIQKAAAWSFYRQGCKAQKLIHKLKYNRVKPLGTYLGSLYGIKLKESGFADDIDCIIAVPLHRFKIRKRGFNQSALIAEGMASAMEIPFIDNVLARTRSSDTQTSKQRYGRWKNVEGIFSVKDQEAVRNKHVLLVDDVITTGATIEACAMELLRVEGVKVSVSALAAAEK